MKKFTVDEIINILGDNGQLHVSNMEFVRGLFSYEKLNGVIFKTPEDIIQAGDCRAISTRVGEMLDSLDHDVTFGENIFTGSIWINAKERFWSLFEWHRHEFKNVEYCLIYTPDHPYTIYIERPVND